MIDPITHSKAVEQAERYSKESYYKGREIDKLTCEFAQIKDLMIECRRVLHELRCYDQDFYNRNCHGLIDAIDTHYPVEPKEQA